MEIRRCVAADEGAVSALWREVFPEAPPWNHPESDFVRKLRVQPELFFVAVREGGVVGTVMGGYDGHRGWLYHLAVLPSSRGQGIGRALVERVECELMKLGCPKLNLQVRSSNLEVRSFYEQLGYKVEDHMSLGKLLGKP